MHPMEWIVPFVIVAGATILAIPALACVYGAGGKFGRLLVMALLIEFDFALGFWLNSLYQDVNAAIGIPMIFYLWTTSMLIRFKVVYLPYISERR